MTGEHICHKSSVVFSRIKFTTQVRKDFCFVFLFQNNHAVNRMSVKRIQIVDTNVNCGDYLQKHKRPWLERRLMLLHSVKVKIKDYSLSDELNPGFHYFLAETQIFLTVAIQCMYSMFKVSRSNIMSLHCLNFFNAEIDYGVDLININKLCLFYCCHI